MALNWGEQGDEFGLKDETDSPNLASELLEKSQSDPSWNLALFSLISRSPVGVLAQFGSFVLVKPNYSKTMVIHCLAKEILQFL
jgi:hypothetical protein